MKDLIARLINEYGSDATVSVGGAITTTKMFFQLVTSKSWQNMERMICSGGEIPRGQFLFIAPPEIGIHGADLVTLDGRNFIVRRADAIIYRNERLFIWGLCVEGGGADPWLT
ncbi:MAG: hypothetical protein CW335_02475 [Clostridiales bacterium]|jgi:hypothetical protein|nr:hypothetical protein [Clostridiales bacterium]